MCDAAAISEGKKVFILAHQHTKIYEYEVLRLHLVLPSMLMEIQ